MSKKNIKPKKFSPYRKYGFNRTMANAWNYESYKYWCICDEGREKPPSQRETNFFFKYGRNNKITGKSILSYIPKDYLSLMERWVALTKSERKQAQSVSKENIGKKITGWLHQAEIMYWDDIKKMKN
jgi:hypothetical protein